MITWELTGSTLSAGDLEAPRLLERLAGGLDGNVNISLGGLGDIDELLAGSRVDDLESLALNRLDPLVVANCQRCRYQCSHEETSGDGHVTDIGNVELGLESHVCRVYR